MTSGGQRSRNQGIYGFVGTSSAATMMVVVVMIVVFFPLAVEIIAFFVECGNQPVSSFAEIP